MKHKEAFDYCLKNDIVSDIGLCGVYAMSHFVNKSLFDVYYECKKMFKKHDAWTGSLSHFEIERYLLNNGCKLKSIIKKGCTVKNLHKNNPDHEMDLLLCYIRGHAFLMQGSIVYDQSYAGLVSLWPHKNSRIRNSYMVIKDGKIA